MPAGTKTGYRGKRTLDLLCIGILGAPAALVSAACALAVRLTSDGPVLFRQQRAGRDGEPFTILKFRTMRHGATSLYPDEDQITMVGGCLRRCSLDELPQLWNVIRGDMSLVGPRPTLLYQVDRYTHEQRRRLSMPPGITGLAQVRGRNGISWAERIEFDLEYVSKASLALDLKILCLTLGTVFKREGIRGNPRDDPLARGENA